MIWNKEVSKTDGFYPLNSRLIQIKEPVGLNIFSILNIMNFHITVPVTKENKGSIVSFKNIYTIASGLAFEMPDSLRWIEFLRLEVLFNINYTNLFIIIKFTRED